jgi:dTMP kinase
MVESLNDMSGLIQQPCFFSFDGLDGVGKSTQINLLRDWLVEQGHDVLLCRDPGSTPLGERLREIVLHSGEETPICQRSEMLLYMAARAQLVDEVIRPALAAGKTVVSDRFLLANVVYQGHAGGLEVDSLWQVGSVATGGLSPDLTFLLDMAPSASHTRLQRPLDRIEKRGEEFRERLRRGFLDEAAQDPRIVVIDAARSVEEVHAEVLSKLKAHRSGQ